MRLPVRVLIIALSLAAGSWVGLGRPSAGAARAWGERARAHLSRHVTAEPGSPLPAEAPVAPVDVADLPDPMPFPRLNPDETTHRAWLLAEGPAHAEADGRRIVTFTFDDGPFPETTPEILDLLAKHHVRAAFFWIGRYLDGDGDREVTARAVARQVVAAGHFVGNHTHDHEKLTGLSRRDALAQIDEGAASIQRVTGTTPTLFRPPYGALDPWMSDALKHRGMELVLWSIEAGDMTHDDPAAMTESLESQIDYAGGGIVLLHDIRLTTIPVLASLLDWLEAHKWDPASPERTGYEIVDLAQFLQETGRAPQPFADRPALEKARAQAHRAKDRAQDRTQPHLVRASAPDEGEAVVLPL